MNDVLGYDCDGKEIYEYTILRAIWSNDIPIEELEEADPRHYCALVAEDGNSYAISVYDWWNADLIRKRESLEPNQKIPIIIKSISEMNNYECAIDGNGNDFIYELNCDKLKEQLNKKLRSKKTQKVKTLKLSKNSKD